MMMRQVGEIAIPAGQTIEIKVRGLHIMCLDRCEEFPIGDRINTLETDL
jgi:copper(I)-binding protein